MSISRGCQRGFSLIELIVFMLIVGTGVVGMIGTMDIAARTNVDPMLQKQALAIAESLLAEIQRQPFSYCDPDDSNALTATSSASCTSGMSQDTLSGPVPATESRDGSSGSYYDNVTDYARSTSLVLTNVTDASNPPIATMTGYTATITMAWADSIFGFTAGSHNAIKITVNVKNGPADATLNGYRIRYAPQL